MTDKMKEDAVAWAKKVTKAKGTSYTDASRNAAAFILSSADRIEALEGAIKPLRALLPLLKCVTLRQAVDAGIHDQLGWCPYALNEGADENAPALSGWRLAEIKRVLEPETKHD